jgi:hypothetical protein
MMMYREVPDAQERSSPMQVPAYYLPRPAFTLDEATRTSCDALLAESLQHPGIDLTTRIPILPWQFCCYLTDIHPILLHGSKDPTISAFVPRRSFDSNPFGNRSAVFAASDGIWPMFFALVDRERYRLSLVNACFRILFANKQRSAPYYFFSITQSALPQYPWSDGTIYILPRDNFEQHPEQVKNGVTYEIMEWASLQTVQPLASLRVRPGDFPFLAQVRGHDQDTIQERARTNPEGWPWIDEP